jgi:acetyl-CoA carboxylase biotin carboxyl carrier protein
MNLKELKEIIDLVTSKDTIEELEIEKSGVRLRIKRASNHAIATMPAHTVSVTPLTPAISAPPSVDEHPESREEFFYIKSPIVGTFYKAASPDSEPFVSIGDFVEKGSVVCIIEAMKLMNEIESDMAGEVVSILVENGQPVEYGEKLFAVRPR